MFYYYLKVGGPIIIILLIISIITLGLILERISFFILHRDSLDKSFNKNLKNYLRENDYMGALTYAKKQKGPVGEIISEFLNRYCFVGDFKDPDELLREIEIDEMEKYEKNISILGIIAYTSPMLGLLGTVTGMIQAFSNIASEGAGDPNIVAGGISQALLTTAYGLIIAIPAIVAYNLLNRKIEKISDKVEKITTSIVNIVKR